MDRDWMEIHDQKELRKILEIFKDTIYMHQRFLHRTFNNEFDCDYWVPVYVLDNHGKIVRFPLNEEESLPQVLWTVSGSKHRSHWYRHPHAASWNKDRLLMKTEHREIYEETGIHLSMRKGLIDPWERARSENGRSWKQRKIKRQYMKHWKSQK